MARESFLLRTDPRVLEALRRWADDELRSVNGQLDFLLRQALRRAGRWSEASPGETATDTAAAGDSQVDSQPDPNSGAADADPVEG